MVVDKPDLPGARPSWSAMPAGCAWPRRWTTTPWPGARPGFAGADLANIINEGALLAVKSGRTQVAQVDLEEAVERVMAGLKKKSRVMTAKDRDRVAHHETGHALVAAHTPGADPVEKVSIIPRGLGALGYTLQLPTEERYLMTESELLARIDVLLGGRAAEEIIYGDVSTGAAHDLGRATEIARQMVMDHGMNDRFRHTVLRSGRPSPFGNGYRRGAGAAGDRRVHPAVRGREDSRHPAGALRARHFAAARPRPRCCAGWRRASWRRRP